MMAYPVEIRCTSRHPERPSWVCDAKLADVIAGTVVVEPGVDVQPGCSKVKCVRCGTEYVLCPVRAA